MFSNLYEDINEMYDDTAGAAKTVDDMPENKIRALGRLIGIGRDEYGHRAITLYIRPFGRGGRENYIKFAFAYDVYLPEDVSVGSYIEVEGHAVGYSFVGMEGRRGHAQYCVVDKIKKAVSVMEQLCGIESFSYERPYVDFYFKGTIRSRYKNDGSSWSILTVQTGNVGIDKRPVYVRVQFSDRMRVADNKSGENEKVCIYGTVTSTRKEVRNVTHDYTNFIVSDMVTYGKE